jgi:acetolactate synthase-1/2/3 large subunit
MDGIAMTSISGAQAVARALRDEGIRVAFGIPGAQNLELYDCLDHLADIRPVLVTDERSAPFMAGGLALASGQPGCVLLVPGAGLTHVRERIRAGHARLWSGSGSDLRKDAVSPHRLLTALQRALPTDTIYVTDSGNGLFLAAETLRLDTPRSFLAPVDFSCMGYAIPAVIGAAFGGQGRQVVALEGDGALMMSAFELVTAVHHHLPLLVVVLRDRELGQISQFQRRGFAHQVANILPDYNLAAICAGLGVRHLALKSDEDIDGAIEAARPLMETGTPFLLEVMIDYTRPTFFTRGVIAVSLLRISVVSVGLIDCASQQG